MDPLASKEDSGLREGNSDHNGELKVVSAEGVKSQVEKITRPLPGIPVEVLERMLKYVFLRRTELSPSSDPFPLAGTTHLLLVSKAFRLLCLPFFYHSITISRPSHFVSFFHPKRGIFVRGEEGKKRWAFVRELSIVIETSPPLVTRLRPVVSQKLYYLVDLTIPRGRSLDVLCLLDRRGLAQQMEEDPAVENLVALVLEDESWRRAFRDPILDDPELPVNASSEDIEVEVDALLEEDVRMMLAEERHRFIRGRLLPSLRPLEVKVSTDSLQPVRIHASTPSHSCAELVIYHSNLDSSDSPPSLDNLIEWIGKVQFEHGLAPRARLHGFPPTLLAELASWIAQFVAGRSGSAGSASASSELTRKKLLSSSRILVWGDEDGSTVSVDCSKIKNAA